MLGGLAGAVPDPQQILVTDVETHRVLVPACELVEALKLSNTEFRIDQPNNVTAAIRTQVVDELPGDVGNDVSYIFLLLSAAEFARARQLPLHNCLLPRLLLRGYFGWVGLHSQDRRQVVRLAGHIVIWVRPQVRYHLTILGFH